MPYGKFLAPKANFVTKFQVAEMLLPLSDRLVTKNNNTCGEVAKFEERFY